MSEEIENVEVEAVETEALEVPVTPEASLEAMRAGTIQFNKLPKEEKVRLTREARDSLEDEQEQEAWDMGWRSPEFFAGKNRDGSTREFIDAKTFLEKIEQNAPVQNERLKTLRERENANKIEMEELRAEVRKANEIAKMNFERSLKGEESSIEARIKEAREMGDFDAYDALLAEKNDITKGQLKLKEYEPEVVAPPVQTEVQPEVKEWGARNQWFWTDTNMQQFAIGQEEQLRVSRPDLDLSQRLELITQQAKLTFPSNFPAEPKPAVLPAKKAGSFSSNKKVENSFSALPVGEQRQAEQMIRSGVFKDKSDFMKSYNNLK